jgi:hypothetical protein
MLKVYIQNSLQIFILEFFFGMILNKIFNWIDINYPKIPKKLLGFAQLISIIALSYYLPTISAKYWSDQEQIYTPSVLFSTFIFTLQTTMLKNLDF